MQMSFTPRSFIAEESISMRHHNLAIAVHGILVPEHYL